MLAGSGSQPAHTAAAEHDYNLLLMNGESPHIHNTAAPVHGREQGTGKARATGRMLLTVYFAYPKFKTKLGLLPPGARHRMRNCVNFQ
ncbi:hypothetical protein ElyMa_001751900 [Elysia marginata]|uniref:Uncharacterized protein n=1 Tax=Elysia marginata TaxID=1093978 RepID=A0AAV4EAG1_9GAST|nr:hypothetical protein ElyMa_001751900 [Elysia marginata]